MGGVPPKDPDRRARRNKDPINETVIETAPVKPPPFPTKYKREPELQRWWNKWCDSPQAEMFSLTDWEFLRDTLPLVKAYYEGDMKVASEIRLRVAKFGATPEDRLRLRLRFVDADDEKKPKPGDISGSNVRQLFEDIQAG